jgi:hypothetical protein
MLAECTSDVFEAACRRRESEKRIAKIPDSEIIDLKKNIKEVEKILQQLQY